MSIYWNQSSNKILEDANILWQNEHLISDWEKYVQFRAIIKPDNSDPSVHWNKYAARIQWKYFDYYYKEYKIGGATTTADTLEECFNRLRKALVDMFTEIER